MVRPYRDGMNRNERRTLALAALITGAAIPAFGLIFGLWGHAGVSQADSQDPLRVAALAAAHPAVYAALPLVGVAMHLAALVLVIGLHRRLAPAAPLWVGAASALGLFWVSADLLQNLMHYVLFMGPTSPAALPAAVAATDALWHAGHMGGGLWVASLAFTGGAIFSRSLRVACLLCGAVFTLHPLVFPLWAGWFSIELAAVPLWAFWTAGALWRGRAAQGQGQAQASTSIESRSASAIDQA
jgi:hypothetical protein